MWYLHNHFVCARLLALCAIAAPSFLAISDLNNRYARRKDLICKAKVFSTRIAGGFMFRTLLVLNKAKALMKNATQVFALHLRQAWAHLSEVIFLFHEASIQAQALLASESHKERPCCHK